MRNDYPTLQKLDSPEVHFVGRILSAYLFEKTKGTLTDYNLAVCRASSDLVFEVSGLNMKMDVLKRDPGRFKEFLALIGGFREVLENWLQMVEIENVLVSGFVETTPEGRVIVTDKGMDAINVYKTKRLNVSFSE